MKNDSPSISAHEINAFTYCPHQWYYARLHGPKALRAMHKERNESLGLTDATTANFARGLAFHRRFAARSFVARKLRWIILAGLAALLVWLARTQGGF